MIIEIFCSGPAHTNAILIGCSKTKRGAIVDAPFDSSDSLIERAEQLGLTLEMLLITHSHWDHIAEAAYLKKTLNIPIYIHSADAENLRFPGIDGIPLICDVEGVQPDHLLKDGQKLKLGELEIEVIHTPGHSPGGVCFYIAEEKVLISGDTLFKGTIGNLSFPTGQPERMWHSLERLAKLPRDTRVIPGHGDETTIGREQWLAHARSYFDVR